MKVVYIDHNLFFGILRKRLFLQPEKHLVQRVENRYLTHFVQGFLQHLIPWSQRFYLSCQRAAKQQEEKNLWLTWT